VGLTNLTLRNGRSFGVFVASGFTGFTMTSVKVIGTNDDCVYFEGGNAGAKISLSTLRACNDGIDFDAGAPGITIASNTISMVNVAIIGSGANAVITGNKISVTRGKGIQMSSGADGAKVSGNLQCNDGEVLTRWAIAGEGLAWRSAWEVSEEVKRGRLVTVLDEFSIPGNNINAVYPERRLLPAKVKFFIEFLRKAFGDPPYWE
jgi:hypothetical protein